MVRTETGSTPSFLASSKEPIMKAQFAIAALLLLAGSAAAGGAGQRTAPREGIGDARQCLDESQIISRRAEDERTIRFETLGGRVYRNRLSGRCPGLRQNANGFGALAFEIHGGRLCRGDRVRVVDTASNSTGAYRNAIPCPLGDFVPISNTSGAAARQ
jgi:hypothetical protein